MATATDGSEDAPASRRSDPQSRGKTRTRGHRCDRRRGEDRDRRRRRDARRKRRPRQHEPQEVSATTAADPARHFAATRPALVRRCARRLGPSDRRWPRRPSLCDDGRRDRRPAQCDRCAADAHRRARPENRGGGRCRSDARRARPPRRGFGSGDAGLDGEPRCAAERNREGGFARRGPGAGSCAGAARSTLPRSNDASPPSRRDFSRSPPQSPRRRRT